jgi:hypothetical protein
MRLPKVLRAARALHRQASVSEQVASFNRGFNAPGYFDLPDALSGSTRITGNQTASFDAIEQAARNGSTRRRG